MVRIKISKQARRELKKVLDDYNKFHFGFEATKLYKVKKFKVPDRMFMLGMLKLLVYETRKKGDIKNTLYIHKLSSPYPVLAADRMGKGAQLFILGGSYSVEERGIVD